MLTREKYKFYKGKDMWTSVPIEKDDIIEYIEKRVKCIESDFKHCSNSNFLCDIEFLHNIVHAFYDVGVLTAYELKKYLHIYESYYNKYRELKGY